MAGAFLMLGFGTSYFILSVARSSAYENIDNRVLNAANPNLDDDDPSGRHMFDELINRKIRHRRQLRAMYNAGAQPRWMDTAINKAAAAKSQFVSVKRRAPIWW